MFGSSLKDPLSSNKEIRLLEKGCCTVVCVRHGNENEARIKGRSRLVSPDISLS